ncbi:hypothetical protein ABT390_14165 [Streptomyces aurantiacus]|uniref:Putative Lipoprotein CseA n=1 Tax=Streptomyces aurantiacus JA 4570 TaxID=1286094 RepID=S3ZCQ5_9ACTN|nr:hypothetical protein [Streptomyces aurantiacus]EPH40923.1 putative Lipoprotein CseA [Streptomyces aurantiacus JA 4570]
MAVLAALGLLAALTGCSTGGSGTRDEGPARVGALPPTSHSASPSPTPKSVDAVRMVKNDPKVSLAVKSDLKPCAADEYPVDVSYGNLTGAGSADVVVNVLTCDDRVGIGSYVYRPEGKKYENVFADEQPPVYAEIDRGDLVLSKQLFGKDGSVSDPTGEEIITYRWTDNRFAETERTRNNYSSAVSGETSAPAEN